MEFWEIQQENLIKLKDGDFNRVLTIYRNGDEVMFEEGNEDCFDVWLSKENAVKALKEAIAFIESDN